ncbi:MAG: Lipid A biosynthesis lauroyltransferase [Phycisphaerae bacterium]|nr:Lipid A biosynthesis lauroyltransferase [Phycisphaerae bacterium]
MARRTPTRNRAEYLLFQALRLAIQLLPVEANFYTSRVLGWLWARILPQHFGRAVEHLTWAFGAERTPGEIRRLALASMQNFMLTGIELIQSPRLLNARCWPRYVRLHNLDDAIQIFMKGRGAILVTGHLGNFELLSQVIACFGANISAIMRAIDNPLINDWMVRTRARTGVELIYKKGAMEAAEEVLTRGHLLGFMADQNAGSRGVFVDFFGRPASTFRSIALLAIEYEVPIIVGYCQRVAGVFQHVMGCERIIRPEEWRNQSDALVWITQTYTTAIENCIRRQPQQYLWTHRRWKSQPPVRNVTAGPVTDGNRC